MLFPFILHYKDPVYTLEFCQISKPWWCHWKRKWNCSYLFICSGK